MGERGARATLALADPLALREPGMLLALAERVLELARSAGADEAEVFVQESRSLGVDLERSMVEGATSGGDFGLGVRVLRQGRAGFGYAVETSKARRAIEAALHVAAQGPREALRFPEPQPCPAGEALDARILALGPEELADRAQLVLQAARDVEPAIEVSGGGLGAGAEVWALANSRGLRHEERSASMGASASCVLKGAALSTGHDHMSARRDALDLEGIGRRAAQLAVDLARPKPVASKDYTLLLKPDALQELLEFCCLRGLMGENLERKESPFLGQQGKQVAWKELGLYDDGTLPGGLGTSQRDDEGLPTRRTPLIERGKLVGTLHDLRSAKRAQAQPTASAARADRGEGERGFTAQPRATGMNFVVDGPRQPLDELIAETKRGLLLHDVIGAHTANVVTGEFHVNSAMLFLVEKGELKGPAKSVMVSGSMRDWLKHTTGLSEEHRDVGGYSTPASLRLPWFRVEGVTVHA
ncbi:MAG: TldD/PmbA family protein, partial [Halobacteriales archaeon]|nr:TldD/PmbA family protein [Halobacteriales archaeon]